MVVLSSLRRALSALGRSPVLFVVTGLAALLQLPALLAGALDPGVAVVVTTVFNFGFILVLPFVQGGFLAMANEALAGSPALGTFVDAGKANYVQLLIGYAVLLGVNVVLGVGAFLLLLFGGGLLFVLAPDPTGLPVLAGLGLVVLLVVLVYLLVVFFVQFYAHAVVLDDHSAIDGFRRSVDLVRENLWAVTGYSLLLSVPGGLFGLLVGGASFLLAPPPGLESIGIPRISLGAKAAVLLAVLVVTALSTAVFLVYSVAFYRELRARTPAEPA
jgi:hypothetical protein